MSDDLNPYQSPQAEAAPVPELSGGPVLTENMLLNLKAASPWLRFLGVVGFVVSGAILLVGVTVCVGVGVFASAFDIGAGFSGGLGVLSGGIYLGLGVLSFFPALFTYRFGVKIRQYLITGSIVELELAFKNNRSLWLFNGILTIISLAAAPALIIITMLFAAYAANM